jgi:hypothetical protein
MKLLKTQPRVGYLLLKRVAAVLANRLEQTRDILLGPEETGEMPSSGVLQSRVFLAQTSYMPCGDF